MAKTQVRVSRCQHVQNGVFDVTTTKQVSTCRKCHNDIERTETPDGWSNWRKRQAPATDVAA